MGLVKHVTVLVIGTVIGLVNCSFDTCLKTDSISCLQLQIYKSSKDLLEKSNIEFFGGLSINKSQDRSGKSLDEIETEQRIIRAKDVEQRQVALQDYFAAMAKHLWNEGSVSWNPVQAARSLIDSVPSDVRSEITNFVAEGRGKQKKQMRMLLPLLIAIKLKLAALASLAYMGIAVIAKKAVLAGAISLLVSGFVAVKNLIESHRKTEDMPGYHMGYEPVNPWHATQGLGVGVYDHDLTASHTKQE